MRVRANVAIYHNGRLYSPGDEFDYEGEIGREVTPVASSVEENKKPPKGRKTQVDDDPLA